MTDHSGDGEREEPPTFWNITLPKDGPLRASLLGSAYYDAMVKGHPFGQAGERAADAWMNAWADLFCRSVEATTTILGALSDAARPMCAPNAGSPSTDP